jgi:putative transposase
MLRAYKTELDVNDKQRTLLSRCSGTARFVFNWALADRIERHKNDLTTNKFEQKKRFNALKAERFPWLYDVPYVITQEEFDKCDLAFQNFFRRVQNGEKLGFPKFKSKKHGMNKFTLRGNISVRSSRIKLPRIGWLRLKEDDYLPTKGVKILFATISNQAGHWFVSLQVDEPDKINTHAHHGVIGVDIGITHLAVCSNGKVFENPKVLNHYESRVAHMQREFERRDRNSKNQLKTKIKIAKLHYRIANIRRYALHEVSHYLTAIAKPEVIVLEDLNVKGMTQNHHLAKALLDVAFRELRRQTEYKAAWQGERVVIADRWEPSSKKCSSCGAINHELKLSDRQWVCMNCGTLHDRDLNAAKNLEVLAL